MRTNLGDVGTQEFRRWLLLPETAFPLRWDPAPDFRVIVGCCSSDKSRAFRTTENAVASTEVECRLVEGSDLFMNESTQENGRRGCRRSSIRITQVLEESRICMLQADYLVGRT